MSSFCVATLKKDSVFYAIFPNGAVPIVSRVPEFVRLERLQGLHACYFLDWTQLSDEEKTRVAQTASRMAGSDPAEVIQFMDNGGKLPVRQSQTTYVTATGVHGRTPAVEIRSS